MALIFMKIIKDQKVSKERINKSHLRQVIKVWIYSIIDGADKIENVCSMEIVIRNMIFWKKKWVDYKNYT